MPYRIRGSDGPTRVTRRRLYPDVVEYPGPEKLSVCDAVQRDASSHHQILATRQLPGRAGNLNDNLLRYLLNGERHIHVDLGNLGLRFSARHSKKLLPPF